MKTTTTTTTTSNETDKYDHIPVDQLTHEQLIEIVRHFRQQRKLTTNNTPTPTIPAKNTSHHTSNTPPPLASSSSSTATTVEASQPPTNNNNNKIEKQQKTRKLKKQQKKKEFDWSKIHTRQIALKIAYIGYNYQGFAAQLHTDNTVEYHLFEALKKTKLIQSEGACNYSRCGRTDKGVSALCQVVGLEIRSALKPPPPAIICHTDNNNNKSSEKNDEKVSDEKVSGEEQVFTVNFSHVNQQQDELSATKELDYVRMLNKTLPDDIRILGWAPVGREFDARFGCLYRTYKYFFVRGNLDVEAMRKASQYFIGYHDYRNFCKMNAESVKNFRRKVLNVSIQRSGMFHQSTQDDESHAIYEIVVCGYSFLWHQIRCMASILFHVGRGEEKPEIIQQMLDAEKYPRKPQYTIASEFPLCLWDCVFEDIKWIHCQTMDAQHEIAKHYLAMWTKNVLRTAMIDTMLSHVYSSLVLNQPNVFKLHNEQYANAKYVPFREVEFNSDIKFAEYGPKYVPLMDRPTGTSFEEKMDVIVKRKQKAADGEPADDDEDDYDGE